MEELPDEYQPHRDPYLDGQIPEQMLLEAEVEAPAETVVRTASAGEIIINGFNRAAELVRNHRKIVKGAGLTALGAASLVTGGVVGRRLVTR